MSSPRLASSIIHTTIKSFFLFFYFFFPCLSFERRGVPWSPDPSRPRGDAILGWDPQARFDNLVGLSLRPQYRTAHQASSQDRPKKKKK